jgi:23S rRNA (uracil1939-C5)-methyltransferase
MPETPTRCGYFPKCNACQYWHLDYKHQTKIKVQELKELMGQNGLQYTGPVEFVSCGEFGFRNRIDFTFRFNDEANVVEYGFYDSDRNLLSIKKCLQLSPELQEIYDEFTSLVPSAGSLPIKKGSVRLRSGLNGLKGCWLDLSNVDIKALLEDQKYLRELLGLGFIVEIGQKGKSLAEVGGKLKLSDPLPRFWFKTVDQHGHEIPLQSLIYDFTQPSYDTAAELTKTVLDWTTDDVSSSPLSVLEFGAGIGQFTAALLASGHTVTALEVDSSAYESLRLNSAEFQDRIRIYHDDYHRRSIQAECDVILVNPARSGLKGFVDSISRSKVNRLIYISCFPQSLCEDLAKLKNYYKPLEVKIVDQFPQTRHFESCVLLERIK